MDVVMMSGRGILAALGMSITAALLLGAAGKGYLAGVPRPVVIALWILSALSACQSAEAQQLQTLGAVCVFGGCMLAACVMDLKEQAVYRYIWPAAGLPVAFLLWTNRADLLWDRSREFAVFAALQQLLFGRMYGRADCHAFCACAAVMLAWGQGFESYVIHMAIVFGLLTCVQLCRGNVTVRGRLKTPVPLLPYITAGFWLWVDFARRK